METAITPYRVRQCSKCLGDTEYTCLSCACDLCPKCKESHVKDLKTIDHNVVSHRDNINYMPLQERCVRHPNKVYIKYCEPCKLPVCYHCRKHRNHRQLDVITAYTTKRQQHIGIIHNTRSEALFYRPVLLSGIKADFKTCQTEFSLYQSEMITKAERLKHLIDKVKKDFMYNVFCDLDVKHRCLKQKIEMSRHIVSLQKYVQKYEQTEFTFSAIQFLSSVKTAPSRLHLTIHSSQFSMTESLSKEIVRESLSAIQITDRGNRRVRNECLLKLMSGAEFHQSLKVTGVGRCFHISYVTSNKIWVSDENTLILTNATGVPLHRVEDLCRDLYHNGLHTVNNKCEVIYIDYNYNINKLSNDLKTTTTYIKMTDLTWRPQCVYWSQCTENLLAGMCNYDTETGKVARYNQSGKLIQTIQHENTGRELYKSPKYITENNNGDVVVSDVRTVVVTERGGKYRFSYTGPPPGSGSELRPLGICTDALSHILVCDDETHTVQMIDKDGHFLSHLLIRPSGIFTPCSLSYDINNHCLWVGSGPWDNTTVVIYRYITRKDALKEMIPATADVMESQSEILTIETEKPHGNQCLLKQMFPIKLLHSITVTNIHRCYHISCVTSDRVWISDRKNKLILSDTTGVSLHHVDDLSSDFYGGIHTVNNENELLYIDRNYSINKLLTDMKNTTTIIEQLDNTSIPGCVYWSPSTGDLLAGMYRKITKHTWTCTINRYNQSGKLTQTIQHDNTGLELYSGPTYITENNNGDVVVSDSGSGAVVVTERGGRHRFSYTGHPPGSGLEPWGICTDILSHILVCDVRTNTVHMFDRNGRFLSYLLTKSQEIDTPYSLSFDVNTLCLWVGSCNNTVCVYKYITRHDVLTDVHRPDPDADALVSSTPAVE